MCAAISCLPLDAHAWQSSRRSRCKPHGRDADGWPRAAHRAHHASVLRRALNEALALGLVTRNVAALVRAPKAPRGEMHVYDSEQVRRLLEVGAAGTRLEALLTLAVTSGMREGELLGLHWRNVDLDSEYLQVQTSLRRLHDKGLTIRDVKRAIVGARWNYRRSHRGLRRIAYGRQRSACGWGSCGRTTISVFPNQVGTRRTCRVCSSGAIAA